MKLKHIILAGLLVSSLAQPLMADFNKGFAAFQKEDYTTAFHEFEKYAKQGEARSQFALGHMYDSGKGVAQDHKQAFFWYKKAAEQGDAGAQYFLGMMYANGEGVAQDHKQAFFWYKKAAEQGDAGAQYNLGLMYDNGQCVNQDDKAVYWYTKAAEQGDAFAQYELGLMYANDQCVNKDDKKAIYWFTKAAEQGVAVAQYNLGVMYARGQGVIQDRIEAHKWFNIASANGYEKAREARDEWIAPKMTPAQIQQAQALARAFLAGETTAQKQPKKTVASTPITGTGFIVTKSGELVTNAHVVQKCKTIEVEFANKTSPAQIVAVDNNNDMAILKTNLKTNPAAIAIGRIGLGQTIYAAGYPLRGLLGQDLQITNGIVSGLNGIKNDYRYYQINAAVQQGNSGGPLLNAQGNVLGIVSMKLNASKIEEATGDLPQNVNFAIKSAQLVGFLDANKIDYQVANRGASLKSTEIAERARKFTVFVTCQQ